MKAKSGVAILPTGASHCGYILRREHDGKVWGFIGVNNAAIALPVATVLIAFPEGESFMATPSYANAIMRARAGEDGYFVLDQPVDAPCQSAPAVMPGHYGGIPRFSKN